MNCASNEMGFMDAVKTVFSKYATFTGRARRREYWYWALFCVLAALVIFLIIGFLYNFSSDYIEEARFWLNMFSLITFVPNLAVSVRRLHDIGKSGWHYLIGLIPAIGWMIMLYWMVKDGEEEDNQYGSNPKLCSSEGV